METYRSGHNVLIWFLMTSFPVGLTENEDSIDELMGDKYNDKIDQGFIDD